MRYVDGLEQWEETTLRPAASKFPERSSDFISSSGIKLPRVAGPESGDYPENLGFPGTYPFTRGVQPTMYRGRFWTMRQYAGYGSAEESNDRYQYLLSQGETGLSVAFDLPTQVGYDADDEFAAGEVGKVGVSICSLEDMEILFRGIPLHEVSTSMTINSPASVLLAMYIAVARKRGIEERSLRGTVQNDILKEYIARGTYIYPPKPSLRLITDVFSYCSQNIPNWNTISISGYHIREAGATAVQEVAFALSNAIVYIEAAINAGLRVDQFAPQLSFFFTAHNDFLEEVSKFRAARRLWAQIMHERFHANDPRSMMLRFHAQTAGSTLTAQQPENNIIRVTLQALAAVLGGTQSLHTNSMDEALWLPTEKSVRLALRTQQIIACESGVSDTIDPLGGSYVVEYLTDQIVGRAREYIQKIDDMGGAIRAIEEGFVQREIQEASYQSQKQIEKKQRIVVGINAFEIDEKKSLERLTVNPVIEHNQKTRLVEIRRRRDQYRVNELKVQLETAARGKENLMPLMILCVENEITLGEICGLLRRVWGEYQSVTAI